MAAASAAEDIENMSTTNYCLPTPCVPGDFVDNAKPKRLEVDFMARIVTVLIPTVTAILKVEPHPPSTLLSMIFLTHNRSLI